MNRITHWIIAAMQLVLIGAWLMTGWVYIATPPRMVAALGMSETVRHAIGTGMLVSALAPLAGLLTQGRMTTIAGSALLAAEGVAWILYDVARGWMAFVAYFSFLTLVAIAVLIVRARVR